VDGVADEDVAAAVARQTGAPHDAEHLALHDAEPAGAGRRGVGRDVEVPPVGGAVEEDVGGAVALDMAHLPGRPRRRAERAQGDADPVLVGVEEEVARAAPQTHGHAVGEQLHHGSRRWW